MTSRLVADFRKMDVSGWRKQISDAIVERGELRTYPRKHVIFQQGMPSTMVYAIKSGTIEMSGLNEAGHEVTMSIRGAGQQFGWSEGLLGEPRRRQATVIRKAELWQVSIEDFLEILVDQPPIMLAALGSAVHRSLRAIELRYELRGTTAHHRVEYVLHRLTQTANVEGDKCDICLKITHEEIARICELSRQTVTTILGEMQKAGMVELGLRSIRLIDHQRASR